MNWGSVQTTLGQLKVLLRHFSCVSRWRARKKGKVRVKGGRLVGTGGTGSELAFQSWLGG